MNGSSWGLTRRVTAAGAVLLALAVPLRAGEDQGLTPERRRELEKRAEALNKEGEQHYQRGEYIKAREAFRQALQVRRALYPKGAYPRGHRDLAESLSNLAVLHGLAGEYAQAEPLLHEALAMCRALYPKKDYPRGHNDLATSLNNLAVLYRAAREYAKAEPLYVEALAMFRTLYPKEDYPKGHPYLATALSNLAALYNEMGEDAKAVPLYEESVDVLRALYPKETYPQGHADLALGLNNLAFVYRATGAYAKAESLFREALDMRRAAYPKETYPQGHPDLAQGLNNLAALRHTAGAYAKAVPLYKESLGMYQLLLLRYADLAAEAECLNYLKTQPRARDGLLCVSRHAPGTAAVYGALWEGRAALTRLQERRHRDLVAGRDPAAADLADQLRRARRDLARLLLAPGRDLAQHRADVDRLTEAKEDLEKRLAARLNVAPLVSAAPPSPERLAEALAGGTAFVDLYRYTDIEQDPGVAGKKGERRTERYVAFVVRKGRPVARVELEEAGPIDAAWAAWHKAITATRSDEVTERRAAAILAKLVWEPLREALPAELKTVYLAPEGPLSRLPWGALPGRKPDTVLLDECAVCLVPHGPFLLERLGQKPAARGSDTLLAYGGIDYDQPADAPAPAEARAPLLREKRVAWPALPGTTRELEQVAALAKKVLTGAPVVRSGRGASTAQLEQDLPRARYAHLATHGFFADAAFRSALQVDPRLFDYQGFLDRRSGALSPSVLSGLVLAGANRPSDEAAADRGILTGEELLGLRLEGLELAVLSACETGLGEEGGGEGAYGLQRSFHVAGCQSVIASLWKVDDAATQALMALFYRNLWEKKLDPAEALRQAQLTLYRNPQAVAVAKRRGADFSESDLPEVKPEPAGTPKQSPAAHWAAFTFSGVRPPEAMPRK
jgi:CHAT domain-containing protein